MSLRVRLIAITSLALLLMFALFTVYNIYHDRVAVEQAELEKCELLARAVQSEIDKRFYVALTAVQVIAVDQQVQELFARRDREGLRDLLQPLYNNIQATIPQFHFHLPNSISFLRLHLPERHGDDLKEYRHTVNQANATIKMVIGIEEGIGGLGYRVVMPVSYQDKHQGTVEMGGELGSYFLYNLKEIYGSEYFLYSNHSTINYLAATASEDLYPPTEKPEDIQFNGQPVFSRSDNSLYNIVLIPLTDYNGNSVAYLKIVTDRSEIMARLASKQTDMISLLLGAVVLTACLIMFLLQSTVLKPLAEVNSALRKLATLDFSARLRVRGKDEISEISQNLNHTAEVIHQAMDELKVAHEQTITILDSINALVYVVDIDSHEILFINKYGRDIFGDVEGKVCWQALQKGQIGPCVFCFKEQLAELKSEFGRQLTWELQSTFNNRHYEYRTGTIKWLDGRMVRLAIATDSTERKLAEEIILQSREWYRTLAEDIPALVCRFAPDFNLTYVNNAYCRFIGKERSAVLETSFLCFVPVDFHDEVLEIISSLTPEKPIATHEQTNIAYDGSTRWVKWTNRAIFDRDDDTLKEYLSVGEDITERKQHEAQLEYLSLHDALTGLNNKSYYDSEIRRLEGGREYPIAIIVADLDNLKKINDTYGHHIGDRVLKDCAAILRAAIRKGDVLARVGGDEFVIIMPRTDQVAGEGVLCRINAEIDSHNQLNPDLVIGISLGLAVSSSLDDVLDETYIEADRMMYRQKPKQNHV